MTPRGDDGRDPPRIAYCDGPRLRRALLAAYEYVSSHRAELNRINVFPVADADTGTNMALTLREVADAVRPLESHAVGEVADVAAEASVLGARGNSGMLLSRLLLGFSRALGRRVRASTTEVARALQAAAGALSDALEEPVEGTFLTVARETAEVAVRKADARRDFHQWLREVRDAAGRSLQRTRHTLPALREADVVDAGAMGFVGMLEGPLRVIEGRPLAPAGAAAGARAAAWRERPARDGGAAVEAGPPEEAVAAAAGDGGGDSPPDEGRYCTQIVVRGEGLPGSHRLREVLGGLGTSLIVIRTGDLAKVHIHADDPDAVEERLAGLGRVESRRVEDTREVTVERDVAVVTDSSADLPHAWVREKGVEVVPLEVIVGEETYRDGVEIGPAELLEVLRDPDAPVPTTSQAPPGAFRDAYRRAFSAGAEAVLGIFLSAALSGTYDSARSGAEGLEDGRRELVDSRTGSLGLGMMVIRAVELLDAGWSLDDVTEELARVRQRSNLFFTVEDLDGLLRSGRVGRARAWLGNMLGLKPVLTLDDDGSVVPHARVRTRDEAKARMFETMDGALAGADRYRLGVVHAGEPDFAARVEEELRDRYTPRETYCQPLTAVIAAHLGAGAWGVCYQVED